MDRVVEIGRHADRQLAARRLDLIGIGDTGQNSGAECQRFHHRLSGSRAGENQHFTVAAARRRGDCDMAFLRALGLDLGHPTLLADAFDDGFGVASDDRVGDLHTAARFAYQSFLLGENEVEFCRLGQGDDRAVGERDVDAGVVLSDARDYGLRVAGCFHGIAVRIGDAGRGLTAVVAYRPVTLGVDAQQRRRISPPLCAVAARDAEFVALVVEKPCGVSVRRKGPVINTVRIFLYADHRGILAIDTIFTIYAIFAVGSVFTVYAVFAVGTIFTVYAVFAVGSVFAVYSVFAVGTIFTVYAVLAVGSVLAVLSVFAVRTVVQVDNGTVGEIDAIPGQGGFDAQYVDSLLQGRDDRPDRRNVGIHRPHLRLQVFDPVFEIVDTAAQFRVVINILATRRKTQCDGC